MRQVQTEGEGTGIVIDDQGHILTNYHVISGAETVSVYAEDGRGASRPGSSSATPPPTSPSSRSTTPRAWSPWSWATAAPWRSGTR